MKSKRFFLIIVVLLLHALSSFPKVYGVEDIKINSYTYERNGKEVTKIYANEKFDLKLNISLSGIGNYDLIIDDNFSFVSPISKDEDYIIKNLTSNEPTIPLYYTGNEDSTLKLIFVYGEGSRIEKTIRIDIASETTSSVSTTKNPKLIVAGGNIPVVNGGEEAKINIPIENIGPSAAKDIQIILQPDENTPFELDKLNFTYIIDRINSKKSDNAIFKIKVPDNAEEKTYSLNLRFYYSNMAGEVFEGSDTINIKVQNAKRPPKLVLSAVGYGDSPLIAGENKTVSIVIRNNGTLDAKDVKVSLKGLSTNGFTLYKSPDVKQLSDIPGNKVIQTDYILIPSISMSSGNYDLGLKIDYKDSKNIPYSEDLLFFLPVKGLDSNISNLLIENISVPNKEIKAEEDFKISFSVVNKSNIDAEDVRVSLNTDKEIICKSLNIKALGKLGKDQSKDVEFELYAGNDAVSKNYPIQINIEYENGVDEKKVKNSISQYVGVYINRGSSSGIPRIIVDRYNIEPSTIKAGDNFQLTMSLLNTSSTNAVSNIKVTLVSDDGVFNPVNSSNTIYIESIKPKENIEKVFTLMPKRDAEHKTYGISVDIDYEDEKGNQLSSKDVISVPVIQQAKLVLGDLIAPPEAFIGQPFPISIEFFNMGKTILYNLMIKTEGSFNKQNSNYYVGNFEPGKTDSYDVGITPEQEGLLEGAIVFSFENTVGETFDVVKEFEINVIQYPMEPFPEDGMGDDFENEDGKSKFTKIIKSPYTIGILIVLIIGSIITVKKILKKKREMTLDE